MENCIIKSQFVNKRSERQADIKQMEITGCWKKPQDQSECGTL